MKVFRGDLTVSDMLGIDTKNYMGIWPKLLATMALTLMALTVEAAAAPAVDQKTAPAAQQPPIVVNVLPAKKTAEELTAEHQELTITMGN